MRVKHDIDPRLVEIYYEKSRPLLFDSEEDPDLGLSPARYPSYLASLDSFIFDVLSNDEIPYLVSLDKQGNRAYHASSWAHRYFNKTPAFIKIITMLPPSFKYSEPVEIFNYVINTLFLSKPIDLKTIYSAWKKPDSLVGDFDAAEIFNELVINIRQVWKIKKIQSKFTARKIQVQEQHDEYSKYVDSLFNTTGCKGLVVFRINLGYKSQFTNRIDILDAKKNLNHLFQNKRCNSIFHLRKGYIAKFQIDAKKGVYCHCIFFYEGSEKINTTMHNNLAETIGDYWIETITKGYGDYWVTHQKQDHFILSKNEIAFIPNDDNKSRSILKEVIVGDLCKIDLFIKPKLGHNTKLIRKGIPPKKIVKKRGRPAKEVEN